MFRSQIWLCVPLLLILGGCAKSGEESGETGVETHSETATVTDSSDDTANTTTSETDTDSATDSNTDTDPCGDINVIPEFSQPLGPALLPVVSDSDHGSDNIYAPEVVRVSESLCLMYYGGQGIDGHDQIFLATSTDCQNFVHWPDGGAPTAVLESGESNHVNDPSVVVVGTTWYMYYTDAVVGEDDRIHLATSSDGMVWQKQGEVLSVGASGGWDDFKVGRPAVVYRDSSFWMYYDGNDGSARHVGLATSPDGRNFTKHSSNPLVLNVGAIDVEQLDDTLVMVHEGHTGTYALTSADGLTWCDAGQIIGLSGDQFDAYGQVTPFIHTTSDGQWESLFYGGASHSCWCKNRVVFALALGQSISPDPDHGCEGCIEDSDCTQSCRDAGLGIDGYCAAPGSTDPGVCCACVGL